MLFKSARFAAAAALMLGFSAGSAHALTSSTVLTGFTGDSGPVELKVTLDDSVGNGDIRFTLETLINVSDITGFYFHISDESLIPGLQVDDPDGYVTAIARGANSINSVGGGYNKMNGGGPNNPGKFDVGLAIGTQGASPNFYPTASFILKHSTEDLTLDHFANLLMGARIQSIGGSNGPSAKLKGVGGNAVPEPMTATLALLGAGAVTFVTRRRRPAA